MNAGPGRSVYRCVVIACATFLLTQFIAFICLKLGRFFVLYEMAVPLMEIPRSIVLWSGCGLLVASLLYGRLKDRLFYVGLVTGGLAILFSRIPIFFKA